MDTQPLAQILTNVQFVTAPNGRRLTVLSADDWERLLEWLEDIEDRQVIQAALERLRAGPEASGAIPLESAMNEL